MESWKALKVAAAGAALILAGCEMNGDAKEAVRQTMRDPDATEFRDVKACSADPSVVVGEANGKNAFGAYVGFKPFFYADYIVAWPGDDEFLAFMKRCYGESAKDIQPPS